MERSKSADHVGEEENYILLPAGKGGKKSDFSAPEGWKKKEGSVKENSRVEKNHSSTKKGGELSRNRAVGGKKNVERFLSGNTIAPEKKARSRSALKRIKKDKSAMRHRSEKKLLLNKRGWEATVTLNRGGKREKVSKGGEGEGLYRRRQTCSLSFGEGEKEKEWGALLSC